MRLKVRSLIVIPLTCALLSYSPCSAFEITYRYDSLDRLVQASYGGNKTITYTYDSAGNITKIDMKNVSAGDINNDGVVNIMDAILTIQIISHTSTAEEIYIEANVSGKKSIDLPEAIYILQKISGIRQ